MISELYIENVAIIKEMDIIFDNGLTVFTGESGSGKSIIIESINLIMGGKGDRGLIRNNSKSLFVSALFKSTSSQLKDRLRELGYNLDNKDDILISREFFKDSKNICKINGKPCTVSILKDISIYLMSLHGQYDNQSILNNDMQLYFIDKYGKHDNLLLAYKDTFKKYQITKRELEFLLENQKVMLQKKDFLEFQIKEIKDASLKQDEEESLISKRKILLNTQKLKENMSKALLLINGNQDDNISLISTLHNLKSCLSKCTDIKKIFQFFSYVKEVEYNIEDLYSEIMSSMEDIECQDTDINFIESRLNVINKIKKKYGEEYKDIMNFYQHAVDQLNQIQFSSDNIEKLRKQMNSQINTLNDLADQLTEKRRQSSDSFIEKVKDSLKNLEMPHIEFDIEIKKCELNLTGKDILNFLISPNLGEPLKPLSKIVSGGEMSRIMLTIKTIFADNDFIDTIIFDEIDTGISGSTSYKVGLELKKLSQSKQILCITHSAQIAALSDIHIYIEKITDTDIDQTFAQISILDLDQRKHEISRILGDTFIKEKLPFIEN